MKDLRYIICIIICVIIVVILGVYSYRLHSDNSELKSLYGDIRTELILKDSVQQIDSTNYVKIVNDLLTEKQVTDSLHKNNQSLYDKLQGMTVRYYGTITETPDNGAGAPEVVHDTTTVTNKINITDYYPNKLNYYVKYSATISDSIQESKFSWQPIDISYAIADAKGGLQKVVFNTPPFIHIDDANLYYSDGTKTPASLKEKNSTIAIGAGVMSADRVYWYGTASYKYKSITVSAMGGKNIVGAGISFDILKK